MTNQIEKEMIAEGKEYFNKREYKKAHHVFSMVVEKNPKSSTSFFYLANIFNMNGEIGKAIKAFSKVLSIDPNHTDASISLSILYNDIGRYDDAKKIFNTANQRVRGNVTDRGIEEAHINKKFSFKHYEIAEMYMLYNRFDEALFEYNKCVALDSENLEARIKIGKVYAKKGFKSKAHDELRRLKNEHPSYIPARIALGVFHYGNGNVLEAQSEWKKVISQDPQNSEAAMYLNLSSTATETKIVHQ